MKLTDKKEELGLSEKSGVEGNRPGIKLTPGAIIDNQNCRSKEKNLLWN
jgi:hypothetical protein